MLESNIILGTRANLEGCDQFAHGILTQEWEHWPVGTPVIFPDSGLENSGGSVQCMSLFTPTQRCAGGPESRSTPTSLICPVNLRPLAENHRVLTISEFDLGKFDRLMEYIRDVGAISFVVDFQSGFKSIPKQMRKIEKLFEYSALFFFNSWGTKYLEGPDDKYVGVVSIFDLPYCVPLFNMRRVNGIGFSFSGVTINASKNYGQLHRVFKVEFVYSHYPDNIFVIDGVTYNQVRPMDSPHYKELLNMAGQTLPVIPASEKKKQAKEQLDYERYKMKGMKTHAEWHSKPMEWKTQSAEIHIDEAHLVSTLEVSSEEEPDLPDDEPIPEAPSDQGGLYFNGTAQFWTDSDGNIGFNNTGGTSNNSND